MTRGITERVRVVLGRNRPTAAPDAAAPASAAVVSAGRLVNFVAYARDSVLQGQVRLGEDRLTDVVNDHDEYELVDVVVEGLADGRAVEMQTIVVARNELLLIHAVGSRGHQGRRVRTRQHPVVLRIGPYEVRGYLHAVPSADAVLTFQKRKPMVPLTDASIEYEMNGVRQRLPAATVIVNRDQVDWIEATVDERIEYPDMPVVGGGPLVKDFTGYMSAVDEGRRRD
jgi:hypothetical protein